MRNGILLLLDRITESKVRPSRALRTPRLIAILCRARRRHARFAGSCSLPSEIEELKRPEFHVQALVVGRDALEVPPVDPVRVGVAWTKKRFVGLGARESHRDGWIQRIGTGEFHGSPPFLTDSRFFWRILQWVAVIG